jgi:hypothetical protein
VCLFIVQSRYKIGGQRIKCLVFLVSHFLNSANLHSCSVVLMSSKHYCVVFSTSVLYSGGAGLQTDLEILCYYLEIDHSYLLPCPSQFIFYNCHVIVTFQVFMVMSMKMNVFWSIAPCSAYTIGVLSPDDGAVSTYET